jgi:hypothetical protein
MRRLFASLLVFVVVGLSAGSARAYQPEGGLWWNPNEPGSGFTLELQDNLLALTAYAGEAGGAPVWYTSAGLIQGNALYEGSLFRFNGSQCAGCNYPGAPSSQQVGTVRIVFNANDPTRGTLTWNVPPRAPRSIPIERYYYYYKRGEDGSAPIQATKMLGEWHLTLDFSEYPSFNGFRYSADVLVFESNDLDGGLWYFDGCRPETSLDAECSNAAVQFNSASGFYSNSRRRQSIIVDDNSVNSSGQRLCMYYEAPVQAEHFTAGLTGNNDGGFTIYPCSANPLNYVLYPLRGFRTASRTFVQEGVGPSKRAAASAVFDPRPILREAAPLKPKSERSAEKSAAGQAEFEQAIARLQQRMAAKR